MVSKKSNKVQVGLFIVIAFMLFTAAILILGRQQNMFQQNIRVSTIFRDVKGLKVGNNIRFSGIQVGAVESITILSDTSVSVEFSLNKDVVPYIKKNAIAIISTEGLMGSKVVNILPGTPGGESIESEDLLPSIESVEIDDIMRDIQKSSAKISLVSENLVEITDKINTGKGMFGKIFTDTEFARELEQTGKDINRLIKNLVEISEDINKGEGLIGRMLTDTLFGEEIDFAIDNFVETSKNLEELTSKINAGEGLFGKMFTDTTMSNDFARASDNLQTIIDNLAEVSIKLNNERNALSKFIADTAFADSLEVLLDRANTGVVEVTKASEALQRSGVVRAFSKNEKEKKE
ncbi:MAG: MCE family protein [Bacteroidales bacterium]|nr:MCE family protein [Bacteroidales bacterium]